MNKFDLNVMYMTYLLLLAVGSDHPCLHTLIGLFLKNKHLVADIHMILNTRMKYKDDATKET